MKRIDIIIIGRVQGVSFRYFVREHAIRLDLKGYVKNVDEDKVNVIAEGRKEDLDKLVEICRKGPSMALVTNIFFDYSKGTGEFKGFEIRG